MKLRRAKTSQKPSASTSSLIENREHHEEPRLTINTSQQMSHTFVQKTYRRPKQCDFCHKILWGLVGQGFACLNCGLDCHKKCLGKSAARFACIPPPLCHQLSVHQPMMSSSSSLDGESILVHSGRSCRAHSNAAGDLLSSVVPPVSNLEPSNGASSLLVPALQHRQHQFLSERPPMFFTSNSGEQGSSPVVQVVHGNRLPPSPTESPVRKRDSTLSRIDSLSGSSASSKMKPRSSVQLTDSTMATNEADLIEQSDLTAESAKGISRSENVLQELLKATAMEANSRKRNSVGSPPLNVFTTLPKNFTRFVMKVGPIATFQDKVEALLLWENTTETLLAMCGFCMICLNPRVLLFVPHLILIGVLSRNYYQRAQIIAENSKKKPKRQSQFLQAEKKPINPSSFKPDQISYKKNMQFIQNTMGMYSDAYENIRLLNTKIDWSDEKFTMQILRWTVASGFILLFINPYIPWNIMIMIGGIMAFVMNTSLGKAMASVMLKNLQQNGFFGFFATMLNSLTLPTNRDEPGSRRASILIRNSTVTIECTENQRWWAGLGWIPHMLKTERAAWSSFNGEMNTIPKEEVVDPLPLIQQGFAYEDSNSGVPLPKQVGNRHIWRWVPDSNWEISDHLRDENDIIDEEGWIYTDHNWEQPEERDSVRCLTRRRRWIRQAQVLD